VKSLSVVVIALSLAPSAWAEPVSLPGDTLPITPTNARPLVVSTLPSPLAERFPDDLVPSRALLKLDGFDEARMRRARHDDAEGRTLQAALDALGARRGLEVTLVRPMSFGWALYDVTAAGQKVRLDESATLEAVRWLDKDGAVRSASVDGWKRALATPNDPGMQYLWHYAAIGAETAWNTTTGSSSQRIGIVDSGTLRTHQDLAAKDLAGYDFISFTESSKDGDGRDAEYNDPGDGGNCNGEQHEDSWHGSHVAGTALAATQNGVGIAGLNWDAMLVTGRASGLCGAATSDILEAVAWMTGFVIDGVPNIGANEVVEVVNLSLGSDQSCGSAEQDYFTTIGAQTNAVIVAAAGNSGNNVPVGSPAACDGVIAVGAHGPDSNRSLTDYTNVSSALDVIAPGGDIQNNLEEGILSACGPASDCYTYQQGTSMASPHVAGAVSLLRAANPSLTATQIRDLLTQTGESCSFCDGVPAMRLDFAVVAAAQQPGGVVDPPATNLGTGPCTPAGECTGGETCLNTDTAGLRCFTECASSSICGADSQCFGVDATLKVCVPAGDLSPGASCSDGAFECGAGSVCLNDDDGASCYSRCDLDYTCPSAEQNCLQQQGFAFCDPVLPPADPPPNVGGNTPVDGAECDTRRGNWDCPSGQGCFEGVCRSGLEGDLLSGQLCGEDAVCRSGLCDRGVCTVPCEVGCRGGYSCDAEIIPGGMCRPDSCAASEGGICESDWWCAYSPAERYVCAVDGERAFGSSCSATPVARSGVPASLLWLSALAWMCLRRRNRRR
jgi:hypothetical protein